MFQLDLFASRAARDIGLAQVASHSQEFITRALNAISSMPHGTRVTGESIRHELEQQGCIPHHPNAWGACVNIAVRRHMLEPTNEYRQMADKSSHARATRVYVVR